MLSEDEKTIQFYKRFIETEEQELEWMYKEDEEYYRDSIEQKELLIKGWRNISNLITKLQKEIDRQKEKRENQKVELAILNEKQKEMNKLKNTVSSYHGMFKKQEKQIKELQKENEEKDNKVRKIIKRLDNDYKRITETKANKSTFPNYLDDYTKCRLKAYRTKTKEIKEYIEQQYFEKLAKEKGEIK